MAEDTELQMTSVRYPDDLELAEAALEGDSEAAQEVADMLRSSTLSAWLVKRGASGSEADDLIGDLFADCFGGEKARGGVHRLLGKFNGGCRLDSFLRRVALNRLISLKRKSRPTVSLDDDAGEAVSAGLAFGSVEVTSEDGLVDLLREAVMRAFASADQEKLVLFRLAHSYRVPQQRIGEMWGWHPSKVCRALGSLGEELRENILAEIQLADPWLELDWVDFLELCQGSNDLFDY